MAAEYKEWDIPFCTLRTPALRSYKVVADLVFEVGEIHGAASTDENNLTLSIGSRTKTGRRGTREREGGERESRKQPIQLASPLGRGGGHVAAPELAAKLQLIN